MNKEKKELLQGSTIATKEGTLADALKDAEQDGAVRAILIIGKPEIFTAGNDLDDFLKTSGPAGADAFAERPVFQFMQQLSGASKRVVAAL